MGLEANVMLGMIFEGRNVPGRKWPIGWPLPDEFLLLCIIFTFRIAKDAMQGGYLSTVWRKPYNRWSYEVHAEALSNGWRHSWQLLATRFCLRQTT